MADSVSLDRGQLIEDSFLIYLPKDKAEYESVAARASSSWWKGKGEGLGGCAKALGRGQEGKVGRLRSLYPFWL